MARKATRRRDGTLTRSAKKFVRRETGQQRRIDERASQHDPVVAPPLRDLRPEDVDDIFRAVVGGKPATVRAVELGVRIEEFLEHVAGDEGLMLRYQRAKMMMAHVMVEQALVDADAHLDYDADGASTELAHRRHKADMRKWLAAKLNNAAYGDRVTQVLEGGAKPVETVTSEMTPEQAAERYAETRRRKDG